MRLTLEEQETIIIWDRKSPEAIVYTFEPSWKRRLKQLAHEYPEQVKLIAEDGDSVEYTLPKNLISLRKPRSISEEERGRLREQGIKLGKRPNEGELQTSIRQAI